MCLSETTAKPLRTAIKSAAVLSSLSKIGPCNAGLAANAAGLLARAMFFFALKKFVSFWLMPLPFCLTLLVAGAGLACRKKSARLGRGLLGTGIVLLLFFSNKVASTWLVAPLEQRYASIPDLSAPATVPAELAACRWVVVLGGGHGDLPGFAPNNKLSGTALARIVEGVRLVQALPDARLIVSGPGVGTHPTHASVLAQTALLLGVPAARIVRIETARDTEEEAQAAQLIAHGQPVALVTSAWHLPRAAALFRKAGVQTLPCPTDFTARSGAEFRWSELTWDTDSLERSTWAVRERVGYFWGWLRDKV